MGIHRLVNVGIAYRLRQTFGIGLQGPIHDGGARGVHKHLCGRLGAGADNRRSERQRVERLIARQCREDEYLVDRQRG